MEVVIEREGELGVDFDFDDPPSGDDLATTYTYSTLGDLATIVLPRGNTIRHELYDSSGRLLERYRRASTAGADLERTKWQYDDMGHRTREEHARNPVGTWEVKSATEWSYTNGCQLDAVVHDPTPFGMGATVTRYEYDCESRLARTWDANHPTTTDVGQSTRYEYDQLDRLETVTQPWGGAGGGDVTTNYLYDAQDHLASVEDGEGNVTAYKYSDRDLLMEEKSPVSGITRHVYGDGGELVLSRDSRAVETARTIDDAGRVTLVEYSGAPELDVTFTYGDDDATHEIGRLVGITRHGSTHGYAFDEFGRTIEDGGLVFAYDTNGNRTSVTYPDGLAAGYTFDFADREVTLTANPGGSAEPIVTAATYLPSGPLDSLTFANGRKETRAFTHRYFPDRITLEPTAGGTALFDWDYTTDAVGNPTLQDDLVAGGTDRTFGYQDHQYYLTTAAGPWPGPLAWEYDQIGNRLKEIRGANTDNYVYTAGVGGNTALLGQVDLAGGAGGSRAYDYTPAGHVIEVDAGASVVDFLVDEEGRLGGLEREAGNAGSLMTYDGRGFLSRVEGFELDLLFRDGFELDSTECWSSEVPGPGPTPQMCPSGFRTVDPVYDSAGLLHALQIFEPFEGETAERVLYFAGRPVAIVRGAAAGPNVLSLTTDHLGTPVAACDESGTLAWSGGFEPFGTDWLEGTVDGASENGVWSRFPGQWVDPSWQGASLGTGVAQNVHRWLHTEESRYSSPEPVRFQRALLPYVYAASRPTRLVDPDGRLPRPDNGEWCDDRFPGPRPPCKPGNREAIGRAADNVNRNIDRFCRVGEAPSEEEPENARGGIDVDGGIKPWFVPQADDQIDYCICAHERDHIRRVQQEPYRGSSRAELECFACRTQLLCLARSGS